MRYFPADLLFSDHNDRSSFPIPGPHNHILPKKYFIPQEQLPIYREAYVSNYKESLHILDDSYHPSNSDTRLLYL